MFARTVRPFLAIAATAAGVALLPSAASATSLVYLSPGPTAGTSEISAARPDGSGARVLVKSSGLAKSFNALSSDDAGRIYAVSPKDGQLSPAVWKFDQTGKELSYQVFDMGGSCGISPFRAAARPDGTFLLATYYRGANCLGMSSLTLRTDYIASTTPTMNGTYPGFTSYIEPRFLRNGYPIAIYFNGSSGRSIAIGTGASQDAVGTLQTWFSADPGNRFESVDIDPAGKRGILELTLDADGPQVHVIQLFSFAPDVPDATTPADAGCPVDLPGGATTVRARPRFSPDGKTIAWTGAAGIYTAPTPTPAGPGKDCNLSPTLTIPGGKDPEWARFDLAEPSTTTPTPAPGGTATPPAGGSPGGSSNPGGSNPGGTTAPTLTLAKALAPTAKTAAFAKGLSATVNAPAAGKVTATCTISGAAAKKAKVTTAKKPPKTVTICTASATAKASGALKISLKLTKAAKLRASKLSGVTVTITFKFGSSVLVQKVKLKP